MPPLPFPPVPLLPFSLFTTFPFPLQTNPKTLKSNTSPPKTQADLTGIPVSRPRMLETTALGAAIAAGFAVGVWSSFEELNNVNTAGTTVFQPKIDGKERERRFGRWEKAVQMCRGWEGNEKEGEDEK